jgi:hypothetical protein
MEDPLDHAARLALEFGRERSLRIEQCRESQVIGEWKHATFIVLRRPRLQPDNLGDEIHLAPREHANLARPPTGEIAELGKAAQVGRQERQQALDVGLVEETLPRVDAPVEMRP